MISNRAIEVNTNQIQAIQQLVLLSNPKDVQRLTGMIAALNHFVSRSMDRCRLLFQLLKKWKGFQWTEECKEAFQNLKRYLMSLPILTCPECMEDLYMYLAVSNHAVSATLLRI